jgi:hypothetical protein
MSRPTPEVADIFRGHGAAWRSANAGHVSLDQLKVMSAIERCRTAALSALSLLVNSRRRISAPKLSLRSEHCIIDGPKRLGLLHELVPNATIVALLTNPNNPESARQPAEFQNAARAIGLQPIFLTATTASDIDTAFTAMVQNRVGALLVGILGILGGVADRIRYAGHSGHSCMRGNVCWSDFSQPNPRLAHPGSSCHGRQSIVGATMRPLTNIGLYKIAHSMAVESVETRGTNFLFQKLQ